MSAKPKSLCVTLQIGGSASILWGREGVSFPAIVPFCFGLLLLLWAQRMFGVQTPFRITQYGHTAWRLGQDGLDGLPTSITQTRDGYIWIGTTNGLFRFDGVHFTHWAPEGGDKLRNSTIRFILGARDGSLYIATNLGVARMTRGRLYNYPKNLQWAGPLFEDKQGIVWTGDWGNAPDQSTFCRVGWNHLSCVGTKDGLGCRYGYSLASEKPGSIWVGSEEGICNWRGNAAPNNFPMPLLSKSNYAVQAIAVSPQGSIWAGTPAMGPGQGLLKFSDGTWKSYVTPTVDGRNFSVRALLFDRDGSLWIGTETQGIYRLTGDKLDHFDMADGLSSNAVKELFQDRENTLWIVTDRGVDTLRELPVLSFTAREGLKNGTASVITTSKNGDVWIGVDNVLSKLRDERFTIVSDTRLNGRLRYLFTDSNDRLWFAQGQNLYRRTHGRIDRVLDEKNLAVGEVIDIDEDNRHQIWASVQDLKEPDANALLRIDGLRVVQRFYSSAPTDNQVFNYIAPNPHGGLWIAGDTHGLYWFHNQSFEQVKPDGFDDTVEDLSSDPSGALWITTDHGFMQYQNNTAHTLTTANGLPCDDGLYVIAGHEGSHWFYMQCGIVRVRDDELAKWWKDPKRHIESTDFGFLDGAQPKTLLEGPSVAPDGRLWSVNGSGVQMIDPNHLHMNTVAPPVWIERLLVDHQSRPPGTNLKLPVSPREIEIDYAGLSYAAPAKVRFRYQLSGHDKEWTDSGTRRQAFYNDLSPGYYTFRVIACNNDGVWNTRGAIASFTIPPAWYQTIWFKLLSGMLAVMFAYTFYQFRIRQNSAVLKIRFDERIEERTRLARDLHDTLLQTIQGSKMVADNALERPNDAAWMNKSLGLISGWLERATLEGRAALNSLRSSTVDTNDLAAAFRHAAEDCRIGSAIQVSHVLTGTSSDMHPIVRDEIYRIGYEAINNACVHSQGSLVTIELAYNHNVLLRIRDNGRGIDEKTQQSGKDGHFGMEGMRERADRIGAKLSLRTAPNDGTEVTLLVPGSVVFKTYKSPMRSRWAKLFAVNHDSDEPRGGTHQ